MALYLASCMFGRGSGRRRILTDAQTANQFTRCRLTVISTGEASIRDKMAEDRGARQPMVGQEVRIIDLPADAENGLGLFETLHGHGSADALARHLKAMAGQHFGHAATAFPDHLVVNRDEVAADVKRMQEDFVTTNCPIGSDGQVKRAAGRFGLVAAAGERVTRLGILPWQRSEATRAALTCSATSAAVSKQLKSGTPSPGSVTTLSNTAERALRRCRQAIAAIWPESAFVRGISKRTGTTTRCSASCQRSGARSARAWTRPTSPRCSPARAC